MDKFVLNLKRIIFFIGFFTCLICMAAADSEGSWWFWGLIIGLATCYSIVRKMTARQLYVFFDMGKERDNDFKF